VRPSLVDALEESAFMNFIVASLLAAVASASAPAPAGDPFRSVPRPGHAPSEAVLLPVTPYARAAAADSTAGHWNVLVQDITLARTLERWGAQAGYRVKWDAQRNFLIGAPDSVDGSFETALRAVLDSAGIRQSDYPLEACIYANTPPLVRITRQGEQARECEAQ
jgi:hypothetical protein